jgi:hypothetical protein
MEDFIKILDAMWNMHVIEHIPHTNIEEYVYNLLFQNYHLLADQIKHINLDTYQFKLEHAYLKAVDLAKQKSSTAIYFEYDLDNEWQSHFFLCPYYTPLKLYDTVDAPDDWACVFDNEVIQGPDLNVFSNLFSEYCHNGEVKAYLVARTVAVFEKVYQIHQTNDVAICIAFHDQDPIIRIHDINPSEDRIFVPEKHDINLKSPIEFNQLERYIKSHYSELLDNQYDIKESIRRALIIHADKIYINQCPYCGALRRTPKAKQCPVCYERE